MTDHTQDVRLDDLAATPAELSVVALAAHQAEAWKSGGGPGYGWSCGHEVDRPSARSHRMGCGATSPRQRDGEYRHGYFDTLAEADRAARAHVAAAVLSAVTPVIRQQERRETLRDAAAQIRTDVKRAGFSPLVTEGALWAAACLSIAAQRAEIRDQAAAVARSHALPEERTDG